MRCTSVSDDPCDMLLHYCLGDQAGYTNGEGSPTAWYRTRHRGVHLLNSIPVPKSQQRYVFSPQFEFRIDAAFERVLRSCASTQRTGFTWITPPLIEGYLKLHGMGFAHSFEAWCDGELAGGCFGVQIGAYHSIESMFYNVSHASKAAYGRALHRLKERGFTLIDSNPVADDSRNYGEEWIPHWRFEMLLKDAMGRTATLDDEMRCPELPVAMARKLPWLRLARKVRDRIFGARMG